MNKLKSMKLTELSDHSFSLIMYGFGLVLALCELYKQIFMYYIINQGHYDWWYFPFQLCSVPMYLCLLMPLIPAGSFKLRVYTFMQDFCILGGIAAILIPEGFSHIHWTLTLHGYLWHIALIAISLLIWAGRRSAADVHGYFKTLPLFLGFCLIATLINITAPGHGRANMFYISPLTETTQPVFRELSVWIGIIPANLLYLSTICIGSVLVHMFFTAVTPDSSY